MTAVRKLTLSNLSTWGVTLAEMAASGSDTLALRSVGFSMLVWRDRDLLGGLWDPTTTSGLPSLWAEGP